MKYKITDLMDLYEDKNCPLAPLDKNMQKIENNKEIIEVKASKHAFDWKQGLALAASVALLVVSGFGVKALMNRTNPNPGANPGTTEASVVETTLPTEIKETESLLETNEVTEPAVETTAPKKVPTLAEIWPQLNPLLSAFAQQGVQNSKDLISEEDLVTFAFEYFAWNEQKFSATLEEYNDFLAKMLDKTVSPEDGTSYFGGYLSYRDGVFSAEAAAGDQHPTFAVGTVMNNEPYYDEGRIVLTVGFTVFSPADPWEADRDELLLLNEEDAMAKTKTGELEYVREGQALVGLVDGELRVIEYMLYPESDNAKLDPAIIEYQLNPLLSVFAEQHFSEFNAATADEEMLVLLAYNYYLNHVEYKSSSLSLETINDVLDQLIGTTVSPIDGTSYNDGWMQYQNGSFSIEFLPNGQDRTNFALGKVLETKPQQIDGKYVYTVTFKVYSDLSDTYTYNPDYLTWEEGGADESVRKGSLKYCGEGRALVANNEGVLKIVSYSMNPEN